LPDALRGDPAVTTANGLLSDSLRFTFEDREHNLRAGGGNGGGLVRLKPRGVVTYGLESGLGERLVKAVAEDAGGAVLLGTYGKGLMSFADGRATPLRYTGVSAAELYVQCLLLDRAGNRWIGTYGGGLQVLVDNARRAIADQDSGGRNINALFQDSRGVIWIGGSQSVARFEAGNFATQRLVSGENIPNAVGFAENLRDHSIWTASAEGLFRHADGVWQQVFDANGRPVKDIQCVRCDPDGTLWLGMRNGLRRLRDGRWSSVGPAQGSSGRSVASMLEDDLGHFWLGTNRGLVRVPRVAVERAADGGLSALPLQIFSLSDGLATLETSVGFSSTAMKDRAGCLRRSARRAGLRWSIRRGCGSMQLPLPAMLGKVTYIDAREQTREVVAPVPQPLVLPPGSRKLEARFAVLSFTAPEKVVLQHRFERDGVLISDERQTSRLLQSDMLVPGSYRMSVTAANNDGVWNRKGAALAFSVSPYFRETAWWRGGRLGGAGFGGRDDLADSA